MVISCICFALQAEVLDRLAITIGLQTITELQLDEELRVAAFLNQQPVVRDSKAYRAAADRMVEQYLIKREMDLSRYPSPTDEQVTTYLYRIREQFAKGKNFDDLLQQYYLTEERLRIHLRRQLITVEFVEDRFRPDAGISETDIQNMYVQRLQEWKKDHPGVEPPSLASSRESIQQALIAERTDQALNTWLEESRKQVEIVYLDRSLQ